jgi:hypothetical protein
MSSPSCPGHQPSPSDCSETHMRQHDEDRTKALVAGNLLLLVIFSACIDLQHKQNPHLLRNFWVAELVCIGCYGANAFFSDGWVARNVLSEQRPRERLFVRLWGVVTINAMAIGYLVWQTGGPSKSPYTAIPVSLLVVAQQLKKMKPVHSTSRASVPRLVWNAFWEFRLYVIIASTFYGSLIYLQATYPQEVTDAPYGLAVGVAAALFFVSSMTNYISHTLRRRQSDGSGATQTLD